jgi:5-hydroxyisourate hydrolase
MSQVTTHVLDTSKGRPAEGIAVMLFQQHVEEWKEIAIGTTNSDGRILDLLKHDSLLEAGIYKLKFDVQPFFEKQAIVSLYPLIEITFQVRDGEHYHIPLLLNPYGYSTYKGS